MEIPYKQLSTEALRNLITDFVCKADDAGNHSLDSKIKQVTTLLDKGIVVITYNEESESCFIQTRADLDRQ